MRLLLLGSQATLNARFGLLELSGHICRRLLILHRRRRPSVQHDPLLHVLDLRTLLLVNNLLFLEIVEGVFDAATLLLSVAVLLLGSLFNLFFPIGVLEVVLLVFVRVGSLRNSVVKIRGRLDSFQAVAHLLLWRHGGLWILDLRRWAR